MNYLAIFLVSISVLLCNAEEELNKVSEVTGDGGDTVNLPQETEPHSSSSEFQKRTINFNPIESLMGYLESFRSSFADSYADESQLAILNKEGGGGGKGGGGLLSMIRNLGKGSSKGGGKGSSYGYGPSRGKGKGKGKPKQSYGPPQQGYGPPQQAYGAPQQAYGAPQQAYGAPQQAYGAPQQAYGAPQQEYGSPVASYISPSHESLPPPPIHLQQAHHQAGINTLAGSSHGSGGSYVGFEGVGEHAIGGTHSHFGGHGGGHTGGYAANQQGLSAYRTEGDYSGSTGGLSSSPVASNSLIFTLPAGGSASQSTYNSFSQGGVSHFGSSGYSSTPSSASSGSGFSSTPATIVVSTSGHSSPSVSSLGGSGYSSVSAQSHSTPSLHASHSSPSSISSYSSPTPAISTTPRPSVVFSTPSSYSTVESNHQGSSISIPSGAYSNQFLDPFKIMSAPNLGSSKGGKISYISSGHVGSSTPAAAAYSSPAIALSSTPAPVTIVSSNHVAKQYSSSNSHSTFHRPAASPGASRITYSSAASGTHGFSHGSGAPHRGSAVHSGQGSGAVHSAQGSGAAHGSAGKVASSSAGYANFGHSSGGHSSASAAGYRAQANSASYNAQNPVVHSQNIYLPSQGGTYILGGENGYDDNDPIIEIVVQESNVTLPPPPPITIPHSATDNPQEPVQVFFVKYDGADGGAGPSSAVHGSVGGGGYKSNVHSGHKLNLVHGTGLSSTPSPTRLLSSATPAYSQSTTGYRANRSPSPFYTSDLPFNHKLPAQNKIHQERKDYLRVPVASRTPDNDPSPSSSQSNIPDILNAVKQQLDSKGGPYTATVEFLDYPSGLPSSPSPLYSSVTPSSLYSSVTPTPTLSLRSNPYRKFHLTTPKSTSYPKVTSSSESSQNTTQSIEPHNGGDDKVVVITSVVQSESSSSAKVNYSDGPKYIELKRTGQTKSGVRSRNQS